MLNRFIRRVVVPGAVAAMVATGGFAFMASNTVTETFAGQGNGVISGYTVSNVHYQLKNQGNATQTDMFIQAVSFTLDHPVSVGNVHANVNDALYNSCSATGGTTAAPQITCDHGTNNMTSLVAANKLYVTAAQ